MEETNLNNLIKKRSVLKSKQTLFRKYFVPVKEIICSMQADQVNKSIIIELESRLERFNQILSEFDNIQSEIEMLVDSPEGQLEERSSFEDIFFKTAAECKQILESYYISIKPISRANSNDEIENRSSPNTSISRSDIQGAQLQSLKLPPINLKKFSGEYRDWLEFRDLFNSLIHSNNHISNVQKFHYLRASLEGGAAQVIRGVETTDSNYQIAYNMLCARYDNKSVLVQNHIKHLVELPKLMSESSSDLQVMVNSVSKHIQSLKTLNQPVESWDTLLIFILSNKLDKKTDREWEERKAIHNNLKSLNLTNSPGAQGQNVDFPTLQEFLDFLKKKADLLETLEISKPDLKAGNRPNKMGVVSHTSKVFSVGTSKCVLCKNEHSLYNCPEFLKLSVNSRVDKTKQLKLCFNCLREGHGGRTCQSNSSCRKCRLRHHTLLHFDKCNQNTLVNRASNSDIRDGQNVNRSNENQNLSLSSGVSDFSSYVLLQTAVVEVLDIHGVPKLCRVLLDSASQSNLISQECCERLGLEKKDLPVSITGVGQKVSYLKYRCQVNVKSCFNSFQVDLMCVVIPKIGGVCPAHQVDTSSWKIPLHLRLADPEFNQPGEIDILIGGSVYLNLLCIGQVRLGENRPVLQKTQFGWVIGGEYSSNFPVQTIQCNLSTNVQTIQLHEQISKFWEIEEVLSSKTILSDEEKQCEDIFSSTTTRNEEGRFVVQIPFKQSPEALGDSKQRALKRFQALESKFRKNPLFKEKYVEFMSDYESLSHMSECKNPEEARVSYYFPHHGVINEKSSTTKLRVVFDGSSPSDTGVSLNDLQLVGPVLQDELFCIMLRFRQYNVVIGADIIKMYRQILVHPDQRCLQRILWRSEPTSQLKTFELKTVSYGTSSAPFLAVRCLKQLSVDNKDAYPRSSKVIDRDFYMDDMLTGCNTVEEALELCDEVSFILRSAGFELQKWASNSKNVLTYVHSKSAASALPLGEKGQTKMLGLYWSCEEDYLMYQVIPDDSLSDSVNCSTKRSVLSTISKLYDPLGLVSPCIIIAKIIMQRLWLLKLDWDDLLPGEFHTKWHGFESELSFLNELKIPRQIVCTNPVDIQVHGFSDASNEAYGACIYIRSVDNSGKISVHLLCAKSKVAPLKVVSIPRLELCAALLLSNLVTKVLSSISLYINSCFLWSDSTVALSWIHTPPNILQTFVANRVAHIQSLTSISDWNYVSTGFNPADIVSRGVSARKIQELTLWWSGPEWLSMSQSLWPKNDFILETKLPDMKKQVSVFKVEVCTYFPFNRFSSLTRLNRVMAYCLRFISNCRLKSRNTEPLTAAELSFSLKKLVNLSQAESFQKEISELRMGKMVSNNSALINLNPFLDSNEVLRVGGRLQLSEFSYEKKFPAVICGKHPLSKLIFVQEHLRLLHAGPQLLLSAVRESYWPIRGRNLARNIVHKCVRCFRNNPVSKNPIMGVLPATRVTPAPPFYNVGVDYAGPLFIKDKKGRGCKKLKCYICLFVCFASKAIHIELVTELSKDAFLATFKRFISRRGKPLNVYSDNGTNFVGARNELEALGEFLRQDGNILSESIANQGVQWHFIPSMSPHFGGIWEAGIKSCKSHLKRVLGTSCLTYEDLYTVLVEIEAVLNSRPLTPISSDPNDFTALTPSHFLIGKSLISLPEPDLQDVRESRLSHFQRIQQLKQHFWRRWSLEYVSELQVRTKWRTDKKILQPGALVLVKDPNSTPFLWPLGRIISVQAGPDNVARVATIKTASGILKRSFSKICPLPLESGNEPHAETNSANFKH